MRCLFCKLDASTSRSREHIIPESLGNTTHVLPPGVVCDRCNNYFSREVEKPFLESPAIAQLRFHEGIPSKRGVTPSVDGILLPHFPAVCWKKPNDGFIAHLELDGPGLIQTLTSTETKIVFPAESRPPSDLVVSRFLAKVALESMVARLVLYPEGLDYLAGEPQLDLVRDHARRGTTRDWPFSARRIYQSNQPWIGDGSPAVQVVHESDFLVTESSEWYFILAIFGLELALNMGGPEIDGYVKWLECNKHASPLYSGRNAQGPLAPLAGNL